MKIPFLVVSIALCLSCVGYTSNRKVGELYYDLGNAYLELDRHEDAVKAYSHALGLNKGFALARYNLARTYAIRKEYDKALETSYGLLNDDPDSLVFRELIAWVYYLSRDYENAIKIYESVLEIDPIRETALFNLAVLYNGKQDYEISIGYLKKLRESYPENDKYAFKLGEAYFKDEMFLEAKDAFSNVGEVKSDMEYAYLYYYEYGNTLEHLQEYTDAVDIYVKGQEDIDETKNGVFFFLEGRIQWNIFEDMDGAKNLFGTAIEHGYRDKVEILSLIEDPETISADLLIEYFQSKNLYDPDAKATENEENGDGENAGTPEVESDAQNIESDVSTAAPPNETDGSPEL